MQIVVLNLNFLVVIVLRALFEGALYFTLSEAACTLYSRARSIQRARYIRGNTVLYKYICTCIHTYILYEYTFIPSEARFPLKVRQRLYRFAQFFKSHSRLPEHTGFATRFRSFNIVNLVGMAKSSGCGCENFRAYAK